MQANRFTLPITARITLCVMIVLGLWTTAHAAGHGAMVHNGTTHEIVEAYVSPAGRCAEVRCEGWMQASDSLPMKPQSDGGMLSPPKSEGEVCAWDIKIATQKLFSGEPSRDHIFRNVDLCRTDTGLSFVRVSAGMFAIQNFKDEQGRSDRIAIPTQNNEERWVDPEYIKRSGQLGVGSMFYNGLGQDITSVQVARADQCDAYICGQWQARVENLLPLKPRGGIGALSLKDDVCKLDLQITSLTGKDGASETSTFKAIDFCAPPNKRSTLSFAKTVYGVLAIHAFEDAVGKIQRVIYIANS